MFKKGILISLPLHLNKLFDLESSQYTGTLLHKARKKKNHTHYSCWLIGLELIQLQIFRTQILFVDVCGIIVFSFKADGEHWASWICFFFLSYLSLEGVYSKHQILVSLDGYIKLTVITCASRTGTTAQRTISLSGER